MVVGRLVSYWNPVTLQLNFGRGIWAKKMGFQISTTCFFGLADLQIQIHVELSRRRPPETVSHRHQPCCLWGKFASYLGHYLQRWSTKSNWHQQILVGVVRWRLGITCELVETSQTQPCENNKNPAGWSSAILPPKTNGWNLKIHNEMRRKSIFQTCMFRFHVSFRECTPHYIMASQPTPLNVNPQD